MQLALKREEVQKLLPKEGQKYLLKMRKKPKQHRDVTLVTPA
jgi:hypothetical protein